MEGTLILRIIYSFSPGGVGEKIKFLRRCLAGEGLFSSLSVVGKEMAKPLSSLIYFLSLSLWRCVEM